MFNNLDRSKGNVRIFRLPACLNLRCARLRGGDGKLNKSYDLVPRNVILHYDVSLSYGPHRWKIMPDLTAKSAASDWLLWGTSSRDLQKNQKKTTTGFKTILVVLFPIIMQIIKKLILLKGL